jgi:hypothetical protein
MEGRVVQLYDFSVQAIRIRQMQETSLTSVDMGLAPVPLVGSAPWWEAIERGDLARYDLTGEITREWWGSMADWPEFELRDNAGNVTTWTREGDVRRFVPGVPGRLVYVEHPWKSLKHALRDVRRVVLGIWVEDASARVSAFAPGPGGAGYRLSREQGEAAHFLYAPSRSDADEMLAAFESSGRRGRVWGGGTSSLWIVQIWAPQASTARADAQALHAIAERFGGRYDGGEIIEGEIWGPLSS